MLHANGDAQLMIVQAAINSSRNSCTVLVGDDTDLFISLLFYSSEIKKPLFLKSELKKGGNGTRGKEYDVLALQQSLGSDICKLLLFVYAFMGCDTTSKPFGMENEVSNSFTKKTNLTTWQRYSSTRKALGKV